MFINILNGTDEKRCFSNPDIMNAYLMLYVESIQSQAGKSSSCSISLPSGQVVYSKYKLKKKMNCTIDQAKNFLIRLKQNGLISINFNKEIRQNVITVNAVNPVKGSSYVQMEIPSNSILLYGNKCKFLTNIYMYLTLHASRQTEKSWITNDDMERGELIESLHRIASSCGCCVQTVRNALDKLKGLGLLVFDTIKNVAMKVKMLLYPALKAAGQATVRIVNEVTERMLPKSSSPKKNTPSEDIIQTAVTEDVKYLLFGLKKNNNVATLNNVIIEVDRAVASMNFPIGKLHEAFDKLYEKNKANGDRQITAGMIIDFLQGYLQNMKDIAYKERVDAEERMEFLQVKAEKESDIAKQDSLWSMVSQAAIEIKSKGQLTSCSPDDISEMFCLLRVKGINGHLFMKSGTNLNDIVKAGLIDSDDKNRPEAWNDTTIAQAMLIERLLGLSEITQESIEVARRQSKKDKQERLVNLQAAYDRRVKARSTAQK